MLDNSPYPNVETTDGNGNVINFEFSQGMITWMSGIHSSFDASPAENRTDINAFEYMSISIRNIVFKVANFFQRLMGLV